MKSSAVVGILITSISNFGKKGFYNSQELGMAKVLSKYFNRIEVYKLVCTKENELCEKIGNNIFVYCVPAMNIGINGVIRTKDLNIELNTLIHFADTQFSVPHVYKWCQKYNIAYLPYIGVLKSHSTNKVKRIITNCLVRRNLAVYKKTMCFCKTPNIQEELNGFKIVDSLLTPVGLDVDFLYNQYMFYSSDELKKKYGYNSSDKIILFVGRMTEEKQPLRMIEIFYSISRVEQGYKLLMVGTGELLKEAKSMVNRLGLREFVVFFESFPNDTIWELYRISDAFINLNQQEIFGMAIMEAMYYGCKVIAWNAPGPNYIIDDRISGFIIESNEDCIDRIINGEVDSFVANEVITEKFIWSKTMSEMIKYILGDINGQ